MTEIVCVMSLIVSLALRLYPRVRWKEWNGTDSHFHYYYTELIRANGSRLTEREPRILGGSNECTYPYFYHWLLSYLPPRYLDLADKFSGFIFDLLGSIIVITLLSLIGSVSVSLACLIVAVYMIAPGLTFSFIGPRPYSLTPRNFAQLVFAIACAALIYMASSVGGGIILPFVIAALSFAALLLASQFGLQVLVFMFPVGLLSINVAAAISIGAIVALIFNKGFLIRQIHAQYLHLEWYFKYNYAFVQHKTNMKSLFGFVLQMDLRGLFRELVFFNQVSTALLRQTTYFGALLLIVINGGVGALGQEQYQALLLMLPLLAAFVVTSIGKGRVFGDAERYIEFAYPIHTFLFISLLPGAYVVPVLVMFFGYNLIWYFYNLHQIKSQSVSTYPYQPLLNRIQGDETILLSLANNETYLFLRNTKVRLVGFLVNISLRGKYGAFFDKFFIRYPYIHPDHLAQAVGEFGVTHILHNKQNLEMKEYHYPGVIERMGGFIVDYEDERYTLYKKQS